jgi:hypothetical protein
MVQSVLSTPRQSKDPFFFKQYLVPVLDEVLLRLARHKIPGITWSGTEIQNMNVHTPKVFKTIHPLGLRHKIRNLFLKRKKKTNSCQTKVTKKDPNGFKNLENLPNQGQTDVCSISFRDVK